MRTTPPKARSWRIALCCLVLAGSSLACRYFTQAVDKLSATPTGGAQYTAAAPPTEAIPATPGMAKATPGLAADESGLVVYLAKDENGAEPANNFGQGDPVYVYGMLSLAEGANLHTVWTAVQAEGNQPNTLIYEYEDKPYQPGAFWFRLEWPRPWALGRYRVDIYMNGAIVQSLDYTIVNTNLAEAAITAPTLSKDQEGAAIVTAFNPGDTFFVQFDLDAPAADTPVRAVWSARQVEGLPANSYINEYLVLMNSGPNWLSIAQAQPWGLGDYGLDLYVNGQPSQSLTFSVVKSETPPVKLADAYTARDEAGEQATAEFSPADAIYVQLSLVDVPDDTQVTASLAAVDDTGYHTYIDKFQDVFSSGDYYIYFTPQSAWTPGKYVVYIYINGNLDRQLDLTVQ